MNSINGNFILIIVVVFIIIFIIKNINKERFCTIQSFDSPVCDNYCQKAKLDLCIHLKKNGIIIDNIHC